MRLLISMIIVLFSQSVSAQIMDYSNRGYIKQLGNISFNDNLSEIRYDNIVQFRIENSIQISPYLRFNADVRARYFTGHTVRKMSGYAQVLDIDNGYLDLNKNIVESHNIILNAMVDRMHLSYARENWEVNLGRQRLNWGKSTVWNPNDLFNTYSFLDFDYEERPGTDALHVQYSCSFASSLELGITLAEDFDKSALAVMYRNNFKTYDYQLIFGKYFDRYMMGGGWSGYFGGAGFKGEISYFTPGETLGYNVSASIGADYMFSNGYFATAEILYSKRSETDQLKSLNEIPNATNLFLSDSGYFLNVARSPNPLTNFSFGLLGSFTDPMLIIIPQAIFSLSEEIDLLLMIQTFKGKWFEGKIDTPNRLFIRFKWSF